MKILKKVRLINWHKFQDETIEFAESVLLSGENGVGKSTLLDAIQFVITCSKANFNKAAHEKGKRNLNSYIRCKTGREDKPYERTGEISAHIALEFWDEAKQSPFVVGTVMDSASEEREPRVVWYLIDNKKLNNDWFMSGNKIKGITVFKNTNKDAKYEETIAQAKRMIANKFGRLKDEFFSLIPKALAFKPIHNIKDFVYSYVLDEKPVNIDILKENVRSYQDLERMLADVKQRISELDVICEKEHEVQKHLKTFKNQEYYIARAEKDSIEQQQNKIEKNIQSQEFLIKNKIAEYEQLEIIKEGKEQNYIELLTELKSDTEYKALDEWKRKEKELKELLENDNREVQELKSIIKDVLKDAEKLLGMQAVDPCVEKYSAYLKTIEKYENIAIVEECLESVIEYKEKMLSVVYQKLAELKRDLSDKEKQGIELAHQIRELEAKRLIYPENVTKLQREIQNQFSSLGRKSETRILCELLEITDTQWQNAVEGYLNTQRFYILTEPENFDVALSVYDKMRAAGKVYGAGLINTAKLEKYDEAHQGTLAEVVTSKNIWATRYINMILGKVHRCESYQELKQYPVSITKECMRYQNHVVSAIPPKIFESPYIGTEAYKKHLEKCKAQKNILEQEISKLKKEEAATEFVVEPLKSSKDVNVKYRLKCLNNMRVHSQELKDCTEAINTLQASRTILEKQILIESIKKEMDELDIGIDNAKADEARAEERIVQYKESLRELCNQYADKSEFVAQIALQLQEEVTNCEKEYLRADRTDLEKFINNYSSAKKSTWTRKENAEEEMKSAMRAYKVAHNFGAAETLEGFAEYLSEYDKLKNSQLLDYEEKVSQARKLAEEEFKEQFLSKLQENIKQAQGDFKELNRTLKDIRFSKERYEFIYEASGKKKQYYKMIMDDFNLTSGESLFSSSFNETHKEVIDELFEKLMVDNDESAKTLEEYTDYRTYMDYDIKISDDDGFMLYSKVSQEKSGGETQTPFYITIAASFMQLYRKVIGDSIGIIMMDEAFNNMDDERIAGVLDFMTKSNLQLIIAAPPDKIQYIGPSMKKTLLIMSEGNISSVWEYTNEAV